MQRNKLPRVVVTMGDPAGIGPEICLKAIADPHVLADCLPIVFGDWNILKRTADDLKLSLPQNLFSIQSARDRPEFSDVTLVDFGTSGIDCVESGVVSANAGAAAYNYIDTAIDWHQKGWIDAISTAPINKTALHAAGHHYPGHTEIFAAKTQTQSYCMMQYSEQLTCSFVTTHVGYAEVPALLTLDRIVDVIQLSAEALKVFRNMTSPKIVVCGLNPHAGEQGLFGNREEERLIEPAIRTARELGISVEGPFPPDTCFIPSRRKSTDCFVCMYHDQGHIPLKALVFDQAVNVTLGLPIVRTSVDHGTAFDIVGKNIADDSSLKQAIKLAAKLAKFGCLENQRQS